MQDVPYFSTRYPWIHGTGVSGTVFQLVSDLTCYIVGQCLLGQCDTIITCMEQKVAFQRYPTYREILVSVAPDHIPLAIVAVLPLATPTAWADLSKILGLPLPKPKPRPTGKPILIWGGSSSRMASAIQHVSLCSSILIDNITSKLAAAAGFILASTAEGQTRISPKALAPPIFSTTNNSLLPRTPWKSSNLEMLFG